MEVHGIGNSVRWAVLWRTDDDHIIQHEVGQDLLEAVRVFNLAVSSGKEDATLQSMNVGFSPPEKWQPHAKRVIKKVKVKRKGKVRTVERRVFVHVVPMAVANEKGIFWCPYCIKHRRFGKQRSYFYAGKYRRDPNKRGSLYCPMCGISHRDFHVRKWNPVAARLYASESRRTKNRGKARRSTTRR